jgi:hypothetical protein
MSDGVALILGTAIVLATLSALRSMQGLWRDRQAELALGRDDGTKPWLLTRVVVLCAGATAVGLWLSMLSVARLLGVSFEWSPPVSFAIGLGVTLLPSYIWWEFSRRSGR